MKEEKTEASSEVAQYEKYGEHYDEPEFWKKLQRLPRSAMGQVMEKALLLRELLFDAETPFWIRGTLIAALGYFVMPCDVVADIIPGAGFLDDLAVMGLVLANLDHLVTEDIRDRVRRRMPGGLQLEKDKESTI